MKTQVIMKDGTANQRKDKFPTGDKSWIKDTLIAIGCMTLFPLIYLIGRIIVG